MVKRQFATIAWTMGSLISAQALGFMAERPSTDANPTTGPMATADTVTIAPSQAREPTQALAQAAVSIRGGGSLLAQGVVLADDGRIVTCLTSLGAARVVDVRYPNGRVLQATLVAQDIPWNLALLQPRGGHWSAGVSLAPGAQRQTRATISTGDPAGISSINFVRRRTFVQHGELLREAWQLDPAPTQSIGSGVLNVRGQLAAVLVGPRGLSNAAAAPPAVFGAPARAIAALVSRTGITARPWLGFNVRAMRRGESAPGIFAGALRVLDVTDGGPAQRAGIVAGDTPDHLVGVDGVPVRVEADLARVLEGHVAGDNLTLRVVRGGSTYDVPIELGRYPSIGP
ncbi:MAG: S1C family serine protease [Deltaproteobacteria bacterium]|nr:S1C family serine protease [Deltaproteobacteria bacterium]